MSASVGYLYLLINWSMPDAITIMLQLRELMERTAIETGGGLAGLDDMLATAEANLAAASLESRAAS
jgi:hypothetical protein